MHQGKSCAKGLVNRKSKTSMQQSPHPYSLGNCIPALPVLRRRGQIVRAERESRDSFLRQLAEACRQSGVRRCLIVVRDCEGPTDRYPDRNPPSDRYPILPMI